MNCTVREMRAGLLYKMGMTKTAEDLRYPIGRFRAVMPVTSELRAAAIDAIAGLPDRMRAAVADLTDDQLDTPYRPEGWTVRQVVHHVADSHMNGLIRVKLALTEETPTIKPYDENAWALLADMRLPVERVTGTDRRRPRALGSRLSRDDRRGVRTRLRAPGDRCPAHARLAPAAVRLALPPSSRPHH